MAGGPGAYENPQIGAEQSAWAQDPTGADAFAALNPTAQQKFEQAYAQSPGFAAKNPWSFATLAQQENVPAHAVDGIKIGRAHV